jgi:hypothetical protein
VYLGTPSSSPGEYEVTLGLFSAATGERNLVRRRLQISPLKHEPFSGSWNDMPSIEFLDNLEEPDSFYRPDIACPFSSSGHGTELNWPRLRAAITDVTPVKADVRAMQHGESPLFLREGVLGSIADFQKRSGRNLARPLHAIFLITGQLDIYSFPSVAPATPDAPCSCTVYYIQANTQSGRVHRDPATRHHPQRGKNAGAAQAALFFCPRSGSSSPHAIQNLP